MGATKTRFEYFLKKKKLVLGTFDLWAINIMANKPHVELDIYEKADILHLIRYKKIDITNLAYYIWIDDGKGTAVKKYNSNCKSVRENLSKDQWHSLMIYYAGYVDNMDTMEENGEKKNAV